MLPALPRGLAAALGGRIPLWLAGAPVGTSSLRWYSATQTGLAAAVVAAPVAPGSGATQLSGNARAKLEKEKRAKKKKSKTLQIKV